MNPRYQGVCMTDVIQLPAGKRQTDVLLGDVKAYEEEVDRAEVDRMVREIVADLLRDEGSTTSGIHRALERLTTESGAVRGVLFMEGAQSNKGAPLFFEWRSPEDLSPSFRETSPQGFVSFVEAMAKDRLLVVSRHMEVMSLTPGQRHWMGLHGFRAFVSLCLDGCGKRKAGLFLFGGEGEEYLWPETMLEPLLKQVGGHFLGAMRQVELHMELTKGQSLALALLNATTDSAVLIDTEGVILSINLSFAKRLGVSEERAKGRSLYDLYPPTVGRFHRKQVKDAVKHKKTIRFEDDHNGLTLFNVIYPVFNGCGEVEQVAFYTHDITPLKEAETRIRNLTRELVVAQEEERQRIAYDLHDNVAQELATLKINCDTLIDHHRNGSDDEFHGAISGFSKIIQSSIHTVREMAYDLQPPNTLKMNPVDAIFNYCEEFKERFGIEVDFYSAGMANVVLDDEQLHHIQRIVQEALNNVRKHAGASEVKVRLLAAHPNVILRVDDNGKGFDVADRMDEGAREKRMGLRGMANRVRLMAGNVRMESKPGEGTRLFFEIPVSQTVANDEEQYYPLFT